MDSITTTRIFELMKKNKVTAKQVSDDTGISQSSFTEWKKGRCSPGQFAITTLANYFNVSVDYLSGNDGDASEIDVQLQAELQQLSVDKKADVLKYIKFVQSE